VRRLPHRSVAVVCIAKKKHAHFLSDAYWTLLDFLIIYKNMALATVPPTPVKRFSPNPFVAFYQSSIGKKIVVAASGLYLIFFVVGHLLGNLEIYLGEDRLNAYAQLLQELGPILWTERIILILAVVVHIVATIQLALENRAAKPKKYAKSGHQASTLASRTMIYTGLLVICFVVYHLLQFTLMWTNPEYRNLHDALGRHDVYHMVILGFRQPLIALFYAAAIFFLATHLSHGFESVTQTLGINNRRIGRFISNGGRWLSWLIFAGYVSIPVTILLGLIK
jgi:succinate dehydrogenase / fumarate reductase, cytochrome b subunit